MDKNKFNLKKKIFGRNFWFCSPPEYEGLLSESLALYDEATDPTPDVILDFSARGNQKAIISRNPKLMTRYEKGFSADFGVCSVEWDAINSSPLRVNIQLRKIDYRSVLRRLRRLLSMEYSTEVERFEQILYELILVPTVYFLPGLALVHAASVGTEKGCVLLTGTGGVGKSSALLSAAENKEIAFISDDIAVIDEAGLVYANFAWPKIYGYNCVGNNMQQELMKGRGVVDKLHFSIRNKLNPSRVRRKIRPDRLFKKYIANGCPLKETLFLFRENVDGVQLESMSRDVAVRMISEVMSAEYYVLHKYLNWEAYNALGTGRTPLITMDGTIRKWEEVLDKALQTNIRKMAIPLQIPHNEYQERVGGIINEAIFEKSDSRYAS